jgi:hypothetical protein
MSERKYRQNGYQDNGPTRVERPRKPPEPGPPKGAKRDSLRVIRMPGFQEVLRCALCGAVVPPPVEVSSDSRCPKCRADLWSCKNCRHFDTGAQFECTQPVTERVTKKDVRNDCTFYVPRTSIERETRDSGGSISGRPLDPRAAFDNLFRK